MTMAAPIAVMLLFVVFKGLVGAALRPLSRPLLSIVLFVLVLGLLGVLPWSVIGQLAAEVGLLCVHLLGSAWTAFSAAV